MALVSSLLVDEYMPEFSTVVVRDHVGPDASVGRPGFGDRYREELDEFFSDALVCGSVVRAGAGWMQGSAVGSWQRVRLEAHDTAPALDPDWADIAESPYLSSTGFVALTSMTGGGGREYVALGAGPGLYRVRVSRRQDDDGPSWLIQWWSDAGPVSLPRRLKRREETSPSSGDMVDYDEADLTAVAAWGPDVEHSLDGLAALLQRDPAALSEALTKASEHGILAVHEAVTGRFTIEVLPGSDVREERQRLAEHERRQAELQLRQDEARRLQAEQAAERAASAPAAAEPKGTVRLVSFLTLSTTRPSLELGDPLRVGGVSRGGLVLASQGGAPTVLADLQADVRGAFATRAGILVTATPRTVLVGWDGEVRTVSEEFVNPATVDAGGDSVAFVEAHIGRKSWFRVRIMDVRTGALRTLDVDDQLAWRVIGLSHGVAWIAHSSNRDRTYVHHPDDRIEELRHLVHSVDPVSGTQLVVDFDSYLLRGDGTDRRVDLGAGGCSPVISPGGRRVFRCRYQPSQLTTVEPAANIGPTTLDLPDGCRTEDVGPMAPFWEDAENVFVQFDSLRAGHIGLRINMRTGARTGIPSPGDLGYRPIIIRPYFPAS